MVRWPRKTLKSWEDFPAGSPASSLLSFSSRSQRNFWMDHQAHSLQQTICHLLLWTAENPPFPSDLIWILYRLVGTSQQKKDGPFQPRKQMLVAAFTDVTLHGPLDSSQRHPMTLCDTGFLCLFPNLTACCLTTPCCVYVFLPSKVWSQWFIELTREGMDSIPSGRIDSLG